MAGADEAAEGKGTFVLGLPLTHRWPEIQGKVLGFSPIAASPQLCPSSRTVLRLVVILPGYHLQPIQ